MGTSAITVAALAATASIRGNLLTWTYSDPNNGAIPNIALDAVEVWASTTNDRTTATKVAEGITNARHDGLIEETTYYYWIKARNKLGNYGAWYPVGSTSGVSCTAIGISGLAFGIPNGKLVPSISGNALTVAVKTRAGNDPSASDPVYLAFRNPTLGDGSYQIRQITAALSVTIPSGSSIGTSSGFAFRLWFFIFDDAGTLRLAVRNCSAPGNVFPVSEQGIDSTDSSAPGNGAIFYTPGVTVTSKPFKIIGYMDWSSGLATIGLWSALPDVIQLFSSSTPTPGKIIQEQKFKTVSLTTGTTLVPYDDTIPQRGEGDGYITAAITVSSIVNQIGHEVTITCAHSSGANPIVASIHYQVVSGGANALASGVETPPAAGAIVQVHVGYLQIAPAVGQVGYVINVGGTAAGTLTVNGTAGARKLGGVLISFYRLVEIMS